MNSDNKTDNEHSPITPPLPIPQGLDTPATESSTAQQFHEVEKRMSAFERSAVRWTRVAVFVSILAAVFISAQWYEMHIGGRDTHTLAEAAKTQATKMTDVAAAAEKIKEASEGMVVEARKTADNSKRQIEASNRQSKAALEAGIASSQLDQRAWIAASKAIVAQFEKEQPYKIEIEMFNSGKTPAMNVRDAHVIRWFRAQQDGPDAASIAGLKKFAPWSAIPPQGKQAIHSRVEWWEMKPIFDDISGGKVWVYYFSVMKYEDVSSKRVHTTEICLWLQPTEKLLAYCDKHNNMD